MKKSLVLLLLIYASPLIAQFPQTCFEDYDGDGYGNPNVHAAQTIFGCPPAGNWVNNSLDCNDSSNVFNPTTIWYKDSDNDRYSDGTSVNQCERPQGYKRPEELDAISGDCNDNNPLEVPGRIWYYDPDGDFYSDAPAGYNPNEPLPEGLLQSCSQPPGYTANSLIKGFDCNQNDPIEHANQKWYPDQDGDGYPSSLDSIVQCNRPPGYRARGELINPLQLDCDNADPTINPGTIWYRDLDNDGYTNGATLVGCTQPAGYKKTVSNGIDCNDNNPLEYPNQSWFPDRDNDDHAPSLLNPGGIDIKIQCSRPPGYFAASELESVNDCNDNNEFVHPGATEICDELDNDCDGTIDDGFSKIEYVKDVDGDGYYPGTPLLRCNSPGADYIQLILTPINVGGQLVIVPNKKPGDCDDNNGFLNPDTKWVVDTDADGYYPGTPQVQCTSPGPGHIMLSFTQIVVGLQIIHVPNKQPGDCDDNNPAIQTVIVWYKDADNDGYSDGTTQTQCEQPTGYKLLSALTAATIDCNDNNDAIHPATVWYKDADNDGYSDGSIQTQCEQPTGYKLLSALTAATGDCNDNNNAIHPATKWYKDTDNDGWGESFTSSLTQCARPAGYKLLSELNSLFGNSFGDCNDNNAALHPATVWYQDIDNDGYSTGFNVAGPCARPTGWKLASELTATSGDCNDNNNAIHPATVWYKDADNDGYSDGSTQTQCSQPTNHKLLSALTGIGDCNDNNNAIHPATVWYKDADNDGYSNGSTQTQCSQPANHKLLSALIAATGDCNDNNNAIHPATVWYKDADNDGYGDGSTQIQCAQPTNHKLLSALIAGTGDCNDNNSAIHPATVWYKDTDNDGYSNGSTKTQCTRPGGYKLSTELTATSGDCNDNAYAINPAMTEICSNKIDDDCDGAKDEAGCVSCQTGMNLLTTNITAISARLNWTAVVTPHEWQVRYKKTSPGAPWVTVTVAGHLNYLDLSSLSSNQAYNWQIRAYCGRTWTDFSNAVAFTTLSSDNTRSNQVVANEKEVIPDSKVLQVTASPNPSYSSFSLKATSNDKEEKIMIQVMDVNGRMVETRTLNADQTIQLGERYRPGMYFIRFIQGKQIKQLKLVKIAD